MKVWKITNKPKKLIFDNTYEYLNDINDKFGDEKKYYDFFFMFFEEENLEGITKKLFDNFYYNDESNYEYNNDNNKDLNNQTIKFLRDNNITMLSTHMDKFEEFKLNIDKKSQKVKKK
jgi:hypothetical protein